MWITQAGRVMVIECSLQQTGGQTDGLIEGADEGEKAGHISSLGYPMILYTNYGAS